MRRFVLFFAVPPLLVLGLAVLPLALGERTLFLRDVFTSHLPLKLAQAAAFRQGELPLIDLQRGGGQPLLGNPNGLPLYPDNLLYLVADPLWAMNAHFWLHWLLAPFALCWLGRELGLSRAGAWTAGVLYATGGYFFSLLNLYNLVSTAALAPALVAAGLAAMTPAPPGAAPRPWRWPLFTLLLALLLLAGDPFSVVLALALLAIALLWRDGRRALRPPRELFAAGGLAVLITLPQWVELLRILPTSFRAATRGATEAALTQSLHPSHLVEAIFPLFFGRFDPTFWGRNVYDLGEPLLISLFPGLLALVLLPLAFHSRGRLAGRVGWSSLLGGLFWAFGRFNPLVALAYGLPGVTLLRFPVKALLLAAIGIALLGGLAVERLLATGAWRRLRPPLLFALGGFGLFFLVAILAPQLLDRLVYTFDPNLPAGLVELQRGRLGATALTLAVAAGALLGASLLARRFPKLALALLLVVQVETQSLLLECLYESDDAAIYQARPELDAALLPGARLVHAAFANEAFGRFAVDWSRRPDRRLIWPARCNHQELAPEAGVRFGREYDLDFSPEGLDGAYAVLFGKWLEARPDAERIRGLAASGVDLLILPRALDGVDAAEASVWVAAPSDCNPETRVYRIEKAMPANALIGDVRRAASAAEAMTLLADPAFDPRVAAVLPSRDGFPARAEGANGEVTELRERREEVAATVSSEKGGVFVTRRAFLPLWQAEIDGAPATPEILNGRQLGLAVPPGRHQLRLYVDRRPTTAAFAVAGLALAALVVWAGRSLFRRRQQ